MERAMMKEVTVHAQRKMATRAEMNSVGASRSKAAPVQKRVKRIAAPRESRKRVVVKVAKSARGGNVRLVRIARNVF
jgi:hypothetical protein